MDANAPAPKPDMLEQAGQLLKAFVKGDDPMQISPPFDNNDYPPAEQFADSRAVILASAVLAIAAELRDIHNVLHEINQLLDAADSRDYVAESVAIFGTGS